jgi:outer membrane protein insertion porin family
LGYAFANVIPRIKTYDTEKKVDITFEFDKGNKVYFGQINVIGNSKTRDKVIRRELKVTEGELYHETRRRESYENIQRLGFFDEVTFKTSTPQDKPDVLNIDIVVKERNTGTIQLGAGYGSATGFTLQGQVNQSNFLGKGQKLGASLNMNKIGSFYDLNFTEPYFYDTPWSLGFDLYQSTTNRDSYFENKTGGAFRLGHPLGENINGFIRYKNDVVKLKPETDSSGLDLTDRAVFPIETASGRTSSITGTVEFDRRDDRMSPSKGTYLSGSLEYAGLGGDIKYTKSILTARYFKKVVWDVVWRNNLSYGMLISNEPGKEPPFNERFLLGGAYTLRGFYYGKVAKRVFSQKTYDDILAKTQYSAQQARELAMRSFGGRQQLYYTSELEFPMIREAGIKGVVFYDIGQAEDVINPSGFYSDVGFGMRWFSPIGPLRFEWGFPIVRDPVYHEPMNFEFSIGSPF